MSEAILPCAVCGGKATGEECLDIDGRPYVYAVACRDMGCFGHSGVFQRRAEAIAQWNQLQRWIADGRAVEWLREKAWTGVANVPDHDNPEQWDVFDAMSGDSLGNAPTLAEAVRKAQGE